MPNPSVKGLAQEATWAVLRAAIAKMTRRQRKGFRLWLLRDQATEGDQHAAREAEALAGEE